MRLIPSLRFAAFTARTALAALLVAPTVSHVGGGHLEKVVATTEVGPVASQGQAEDAISLVHGAIAGVVPKATITSASSPAGQDSPRASAFDREFQDLLKALHKGAQPTVETRSLRRIIGDMLVISKAPTGNVREESVLDPEFGEIAVGLSPRVWPAASALGTRR